jgi:prepilin-type N-terminal cleavage/methylation domain-containing protein
VHRHTGDTAQRGVLTMRGVLRRPARRLATEDGWTLTELLVAMSIGLIVFGAGVMMFTAAIQSQPKASAKLAKVRDARAVSEQIVREIRQGKSATVTSNQLEVVTYVHSTTCSGGPLSNASAIPCKVTYTCTSGTCTRLVAQPDGTSPGTARRVLTGLSNGIIFTSTTGLGGSTWVGITLQYPGENGDDAITVEDGAALRNPGSAS